MDRYKSMVRKKARAMFLLGGENDDLIQEGMIGLIKAVRDYDLSQGGSFSSFAELCVSRQMYSAIEASKRKKHLPLNSYISLYEESDTRQDGNKMQLIGHDRTRTGDGSGGSVFQPGVYGGICRAAQGYAEPS